MLSQQSCSVMPNQRMTNLHPKQTTPYIWTKEQGLLGAARERAEQGCSIYRFETVD